MKDYNISVFTFLSLTLHPMIPTIYFPQNFTASALLNRTKFVVIASAKFYRFTTTGRENPRKFANHNNNNFP